MKRNLDARVETIGPILAPDNRAQLDRIIEAYQQDNCSVWDCDAEGNYVRRKPGPGEPSRAAQELLAMGGDIRPAQVLEPVDEVEASQETG